MKKLSVLFGAFILLLLFSAVTQAEEIWTLVDYQGAISTSANGIDGNNIVGDYYDASLVSHGFLYHTNTGWWKSLNYPYATSTRCNGVDGSNIVGVYSDSLNSHSFLYNSSSHTWTSFDYEPANYTYAYGIDGNNIVGTYGDDEYTEHGFLYDGVTWTTLNYPEATDTYAYGIDGNNIVGFYTDGSGFSHGFLYHIDTGWWKSLDYPGAVDTVARGVNGGNIVGYYYGGASKGDYHGFIYNINSRSWTTHNYPDGGPTLPYGIDGGNIVGYHMNEGVSHGFLATLNILTCPAMTNPIQLTFGPGGDLAAELSPDGSKIAFHSTRSGNSDIWVMDVDGSNLVNLTSDYTGEDKHPEWDPYGTKLVFASDRAGNYDIWVMDVNGANPVQLTFDSSSQSYPSWSSDGDKIAFNSDSTGQSEIWVMDANGSNQVNLTGDMGGRSPAWSPDGTKIAFEKGFSDNADIWVMDADGANPVQLTFNPGQDTHADWSPDGEKIAFNSMSAGNADIWVMDADGSTEPVQLTFDPGSDRSPDWSADGTMIVFQSDRSGDGNKIWVYQFDSDGDCLPDRLDNCPSDPDKTEPGQCGCGIVDTDSDGDGTPDCNDLCPGDAGKIIPGTCGCGIADTDAESDGVMECIDNCPATANSLQSDLDGDGLGDLCDPCPFSSDNNSCDSVGSASAEVGVAGGTISTGNGSTTITVEAGDLTENATLSVSENTAKRTADLLLGSNSGLGAVVLGAEFGPEGATFANAITITLTADVTALNENQRQRLGIYQYADTNGDGIEDKYVPLPTVCAIDENQPGTFVAACTAEVEHFSIYALIAPQDSDNDGVFDLFDGIEDQCPAMPASEAVLNYNGAMLVSTLENVEVSAVLTDASQVPIAELPLDFEVVSSTGSPMQACSGQTDASGAAGCVFSGLAPDVYTVSVRSAASGCPQASAESLLVLFDPDTPRATGGGFILPDAQSTLPAATEQDKANFGFIVKLGKNQAADGNLEFQYKTAGINLKSSTMTWYTTSTNHAMFQGEATINGKGLYTFRVTATDGDLTGDQPDAFDIKIWEGTDTESEPYHKAKNELAGGSIMIHKK